MSGLKDLEGNRVESAGQVLLVNYWAEWCKPCREEIPELNRFAVQHRGQVVVVGVNFDQLAPEPSSAQNQQQANKLGIEFPVLLREPELRWGQPQPQVLPTTFVIDATGQWRATLVGPQSEESLQAAVSQLSEEGPVAR